MLIRAFPVYPQETFLILLPTLSSIEIRTLPNSSYQSCPERAAIPQSLKQMRPPLDM